MKTALTLLPALLALFLFFLFFANNSALAQFAGCYNVNISPTSGDENTVFIFTATGCEPGNIYRINIYDSNRNPIFSYDTVQANNIGEISQPIQGFPPGEYEVNFFNASDPVNFFSSNITITDVEGSILECGQAVAPSTPTCAGGQTLNCCPAQCPSKVRFLPGSISTGQQMCSCGQAGEPTCPINNPLGLPACDSPLTPNTQGICELDTNANSYFCGEQIYPEDVASGDYFCQAGCPVRMLPQGGAWCSCGETGEKCCPSPPTNTTETNFIAEPGCRGQAKCNIANICMIPTSAEGIATQVARGCSGGVGQVFTAIGCIPFDIISRTSKFFLAWGISVGGGVALLLVGLAGIVFATSAGKPEKVNSAKSLLWSALTGLGMLLLSVFLLRFIGVDVLGLFS